MTVLELIAQLAAHDPNLEVVINSAPDEYPPGSICTVAVDEHGDVLLTAEHGYIMGVSGRR